MPDKPKRNTTAYARKRQEVMDQIKTLNGMTSDSLRPGQRIFLPGEEPLPPMTTYTTPKDTTLFEIWVEIEYTSTNFTDFERQTKKANPEVGWDPIPANTDLQIPDKNQEKKEEKPKEEAKAEEVGEYTVEPEDTGWGIARKFKIKFPELKDLNPDEDWDLKPGEKIKVPQKTKEQRKILELQKSKTKPVPKVLRITPQSRPYYTNRGVRKSTQHGVTRYNKHPAILLECCFINNPSDFAFFNQNRKNITRSIAIHVSNFLDQANIDTVILDPGHGGGDSGANPLPGLKESDDVWVTVRWMSHWFKQLGKEVIITRGKNESKSINQRWGLANKYQKAVTISFHDDSTRKIKDAQGHVKAGTAKGFTAYYYPAPKHGKGNKDPWRKQMSRELGQAVSNGAEEAAQNPSNLTTS